MTRKIKQLNIYLKYQTKVYQYFWYRLDYKKHDADDLCAEVFCRMVKEFDKLDKDRPALPWLLGIAHNIWCNYLRAEGREIPLESVADIGVDNREQVHEKIECEKVLAVLDKFSSYDRNVVLLKYIEGLKCKEIACILNKKEGAIRTQLHRVIKKMKLLYS